MPEPSAPETETLFLGTITGTSVDGLDIALLDLSDGIRLVAAETAAFPDSLRTALLDIGQPGRDDLDVVGSLDAELGVFISEAVLGFLNALGVDPARIGALGSHGQTIRHRPDAARPFTWQIGDPNQIAELTGITTVADFRRRDMAAGGQGAPLVPAFHEALFRTPEESRVLLNIGGISNITLLPSDPAQPVSGFDTGPGNGLLDAWCLLNRGQAYDRNGEWAAQGRLLPTLLESMLRDPYLSRPPPKSTGREMFNLPWLEASADLGAFQPEDVQHTLTEFTAATVVQGMKRWAGGAGRLVVCGGGRHNDQLMKRLAALAGIPVQTSETLGFDGDAMEAAAFAWLAARRMSELPGNAPAVTGAAGERVLGGIYPGRAG